MAIRTLTILPFGLVANSNPEVTVTISLVDGDWYGTRKGQVV